jgi:hypothetical protein
MLEAVDILDRFGNPRRIVDVPLQEPQNVQHVLDKATYFRRIMDSVVESRGASVYPQVCGMCFVLGRNPGRSAAGNCPLTHKTHETDKNHTTGKFLLFFRISRRRRPFF